MSVTVLYKPTHPELQNMISTYNPDGLIYAKLYYENNYQYLPSMVDRFIYYMIYLATYRLLESTHMTGRDDVYSDPEFLKKLLEINPIFIENFDITQFTNEINQYIKPNHASVSFLTGLCVIATNELIVLQNNISNSDIYRIVFSTFNNVCMGV